MTQGWLGNDYIMLFDEQGESATVGQRYGIPERLGEYSLLALCGWDDFIVMDKQRRLWKVPTIPLSLARLTHSSLDLIASDLVPDSRFKDRIKWYVQPLVFGGDPQSEENMIWISLDQHIDLVRWWNQKCDEAHA